MTDQKIKFEVPATNDWIPAKDINYVRVISFSFECLSQDTSSLENRVS